MENNIKNIAIIGIGQMGKALIKGIEHSTKCNINSLFVHDVNPNALKKIRSKKVYFKTIKEISQIKIPTIISVKPKQLQDVIDSIQDNRFIISIAAGVSLKKLDSFRKVKGPTIRVMPNTPFQIQKGISAIIGNNLCTTKEIKIAKDIFETGGSVIELSNENLIDAVTAISGSGPAYVFTFLKAIEDTGVLLGLQRTDAKKLALETTIGATKLCLHSNKTNEELINAVTSPGGTTIHALQELHKKKFTSALQDAIIKAYQRSQNMN